MGFISNVYNALFDLLDGHASFSSYTTPGRLQVYFGPPSNDRSWEIEVWVGATGLGPDEDAASFSQRWATLGGNGQRDKTLTIPCAVWVLDTADSMQTTLATADAVFAIVEGILHVADPLSLGTVLCGGVEVSDGRPRLTQTPDGPAAVISFAVRVSGRE